MERRTSKNIDINAFSVHLIENKYILLIVSTVSSPLNKNLVGKNCCFNNLFSPMVKLQY